jgi:CRISPR-associated endoribonuclease Cas6
MLTSIVFELRPERPASIPKTFGNFGYAVFLKLLNELDERLATELHDRRGEKPFTVSPLQGEFMSDNGRLQVGTGTTYWFRVTALSPNVWELLSRLLEASPDRIVIDKEPFLVEKITAAASEHPWAAMSRYEELYDKWLTGVETVPHKISVRFYSPTTFRSKGQNVPVPLPKLFFHQLMLKWNRFSPVFIGEDISDIAERKVVLSRYNLETRMMHFGKYRQVGFTGNCEFFLKLEGDEIWARVVHLLADFAFFSGVGYKTTMGMGQVRVTGQEVQIPNASEKKSQRETVFL